MPELARRTMTPEEEVAWAEKAAAGELFGVVVVPMPMPGTVWERRRAMRALCRPFKQRRRLKRPVWEHGTFYGYNLGCRCPECRETKATYARAWRAKRRAELGL